MGLIAYYRVSTNQQGQSGLGLEAQQSAVETYAKQSGMALVASYTEVESGKVSNRPELAKALAHARRVKGTLAVAKLDRLSRNVAFLAVLMETKIPFVACDNPSANEFTLHILAAVAQHEAKAISERTKAALAAAKARGVLLGSARPGHWKGREQARLDGLAKAREMGAKVIAEQAREAYSSVRPVVARFRDEGLSFGAIAKKFNEDGTATRRGKSWTAMQVYRVLNMEGRNGEGTNVAQV